VQICICDVNVAIDLPGLPQILAPATDQSCAATSSANTLTGVGCPHPAPWCANLHSARRSPRHRLPFPAGSFIEGFRTPATVQAASLRSAGIRNPQHFQTHAPQQIGRWSASLANERGGLPLARARQYDLKLRENSGLDRDIDRATVLLHDNVVAHRQAKPGIRAIIPAECARF
jgi:hypothetical protein